jgi:hypothetical protein
VTRLLVVANETLAEPALAQAVRNRAQAGDCRYYLVVPASWSDDQPDGTRVTPQTRAATRLADALALWRSWGVEVDGEVGDGSPIVAVADVLQRQPFDEIIVGTLAPGLSRWLRMGVPQRLERLFRIPVHHVIAVQPRPQSASHPDA